MVVPHLDLIGFVQQGDSFPGLLRLISAYLDTLDMDAEAAARIELYLDLIRSRANGIDSRCTFPRLRPHS